MSEAELKLLRPSIQLADSSDGYLEDIESCAPFVSSAIYKFSRWGGLTSISFSAEGAVADQAEFEPIASGFLYGCLELWGKPDGMEVFTRPKGFDIKPLNVGMWWREEWGCLYAFYSPPRSQAWGTVFYLEFSYDESAIYEWRTWAKGDTSPETVAKYFDGFPEQDEAPKVVLH